MTAEEIRNINPKYDNTDDFYLMCLDMFCMFREIAAQLAEVNQKLDAIAETYVLSGGK